MMHCERKETTCAERTERRSTVLVGLIDVKERSWTTSEFPHRMGANTRQSLLQ